MDLGGNPLCNCTLGILSPTLAKDLHPKPVVAVCVFARRKLVRSTCCIIIVFTELRSIHSACAANIQRGVTQKSSQTASGFLPGFFCLATCNGKDTTSVVPAVDLSSLASRVSLQLFFPSLTKKSLKTELNINLCWHGHENNKNEIVCNSMDFPLSVRSSKIRLRLPMYKTS
eukprot:scaffold18155_cov42-Attheya_sp.AAC.2